MQVVTFWASRGLGWRHPVARIQSTTIAPFSMFVPQANAMSPGTVAALGAAAALVGVEPEAARSPSRSASARMKKLPLDTTESRGFSPDSSLAHAAPFSMWIVECPSNQQRGANEGDGIIGCRDLQLKRFHVVRRTLSSAAANRFQLSSSVPSARRPAAVIR